MAVANRAILNRKEKLQPVVEFVALVLNPSQPSTGVLGLKFRMMVLLCPNEKLRNKAIFACRDPVDARAGGCDSSFRKLHVAEILSVYSDSGDSSNDRFLF